MYEQDEAMAYSPEMDGTQAVEEAPPKETIPQAENEPLTEPDNVGDDGGEQKSGDTGATAVGNDPADPADPPQPADPAAQAGGADQTGDSELELIRRELSLLRAQLDGQARAMQRIGMEYAEFCELYPDLSTEDLPDDVWESVRQGVPLSAAYALFEQRRRRTLEKAQLRNLENKQRSSGSVEGGSADYFSADEVRAMSQTEVRANYQKILLSMQKWH